MLTVSSTVATPLPTDGMWHRTDVPVVQAVVEHIVPVIAAVAVRSVVANDTPKRVRVLSPVRGAFTSYN